MADGRVTGWFQRFGPPIADEISSIRDGLRKVAFGEIDHLELPPGWTFHADLNDDNPKVTIRKGDIEVEQ